MANAAAFSGSYTANLGPSIEGYLTPAVDEECQSFFESAAEGQSHGPGVLVLRAISPPAPADVPLVPFDRTRMATGERPRHRCGRTSSHTLRCLPAYAGIAPYNVIVVTLEEHPNIRFVGNLVNGPGGSINEIDPSTIRIGEPVEVVFSVLVRGRRFVGGDAALGRAPAA